MKNLIFLLILVILYRLVEAQAGEPDNSFGTNGRVYIPVGDYDDFAQAVSVQADGKIVIAGFSRVSEISDGNRHDISVARLNENGTPDNSFSNDGKVIITIDQYGSFGYALAIQPDNKILVAGYSLSDEGADFAIARLNPDGSPDNTFDGDGHVIIPVGSSDDEAFALNLQTDGKILIAGSSLESTYDFSVVRLNPNGSLDNSFDGDGKLVLPMGNNNDIAHSIDLQTDGKIVIGGQSKIGSSNIFFSFARLNPNGSIDSTFETDGKVFILPGITNIGWSLAVQPDGKIIMAGRTDDNFGIARVETDGDPDLSFNDVGHQSIGVGFGHDDGRALVLQEDGKILVAGESQNGGSNSFSIIRLNDDGTLDESFDDDGKSIIPSMSGAFGEKGRAMALQADGKILLAGVNGGVNDLPSDPEVNFVVMRLHAEGVLPVRLLEFDAGRKNEMVELNWAAENEINFSHYEIQRSSDGIQFEPIGNVPGSNHEGINHYQLSDKEASTANHFYRLKMIDMDDRFSFSKIVAVRIKENSAYIYPNPALNSVNIHGSRDLKFIEVVDLNGRMVRQFKPDANEAYNIIGLEKGFYILRLIDLNGMQSLKLQID